MDEMRIITAHTDQKHARSLSEYEATGGYHALKKARKEIQPDALIEMIKQSELRGRGGAGFSTGAKWGFVPKDAPIKYLVCNCDESEPGTFKDRLIIERDPHQLIEGVILASYAIGATAAFIYCRGEYFLGLKTLQKAIDEVTKAGYLEKLKLILHPGAGAYIAGEETAQLNSLEGYRATPRLKPPFPAVVGLYGKPTIINNVETLCNVVHIVNHGLEWFLSIGTPKNRGTKIFQVSGQIQKPGCYEFPLGVPLRTVLEHAGWMLPGRKFKACYPGGSSCSLLTEQDLDVAMDFETLAARKSALGTASIIVMDDSADMVKVAHRLMEFYQNESCGKCTPCREGTRWVVQILSRILAGKGTNQDLRVIEDTCHQMEENSFCPLAVGAAPPVLSAMAHFKDEFLQAILRNPNHDKAPEMPISYPYLKIGARPCKVK
jgi:NADH-quinone oxidoreductase subunit F